MVENCSSAASRSSAISYGTNGFAFDQQCVVRFACSKRKFADRNAARGGEVDFILGLDGPTRCGEHRINYLASALFRGYLGHGGDPSRPSAAFFSDEAIGRIRFGGKVIQRVCTEKGKRMGLARGTADRAFGLSL